jgi:peptidoglycan/xylan/chitin deacetylase (PgdA/CDA1 family)
MIMENVMYKYFFIISMVFTILWATACNSDPTDKEDMTEMEQIQKEIDEQWQTLGYAAKPTKYIALSFDDGPAGPKTQDLLNILQEKRVKATFFLIGQNIRNQKQYAQAIFNGGHELANHSDGYASLGGTTSEETIKPSLEKASAAIKDITGRDPLYFRAPNVNYGANLTKVCTELGLAIIGVSLWSNDWQSGITSEQITKNVLGNPKDGDIINCHEPNTAPNTLAALPAIIDGLRDKGFWIMTLGQLAIMKGKTLEAGKQYDSIR